jgi:hypothetical protein
MTRHREEVKLYYSKDDEGFKSIESLKAAFARNREKDLIVDFYDITVRDKETGVKLTRKVAINPFSEKTVMEQKKEAAKLLSKKMGLHSGNLEAKFVKSEPAKDIYRSRSRSR